MPSSTWLIAAAVLHSRHRRCRSPLASSSELHGGNRLAAARRLGCRPEQLLDASASLVPFGPPARLRRRLARLLARLKGLRGTRFDIFGYSAHRRQERALITQYEQMLEGLLAGLEPANHALAVKLAALPERVRGFDVVKEKSITETDVLRERLLTEFAAARETAGSLAA